MSRSPSAAAMQAPAAHKNVSDGSLAVWSSSARASLPSLCLTGSTSGDPLPSIFLISLCPNPAGEASNRGRVRLALERAVLLDELRKPRDGGLRLAGRAHQSRRVRRGNADRVEQR